MDEAIVPDGLWVEDGDELVTGANRKTLILNFIGY